MPNGRPLTSTISTGKVRQDWIDAGETILSSPVEARTKDLLQQLKDGKEVKDYDYIINVPDLLFKSWMISFFFAVLNF